MTLTAAIVFHSAIVAALNGGVTAVDVACVPAGCVAAIAARNKSGAGECWRRKGKGGRGREDTECEE